MMGASNDFATETMTGVQNTQNTSYRNSPHSSSAPFCVLPSEMCSSPCRLNAKPSALLASQCLCATYQVHSSAASAPQHSSGTLAVSSMGSLTQEGSLSVPSDSWQSSVSPTRGRAGAHGRTVRRARRHGMASAAKGARVTETATSPCARV